MQLALKNIGVGCKSAPFLSMFARVHLPKQFDSTLYSVICIDTAKSQRYTFYKVIIELAGEENFYGHQQSAARHPLFLRTVSQL